MVVCLSVSGSLCVSLCNGLCVCVYNGLCISVCVNLSLSVSVYVWVCVHVFGCTYLCVCLCNTISVFRFLKLIFYKLIVFAGFQFIPTHKVTLNRHKYTKNTKGFIVDVSLT